MGNFIVCLNAVLPMFIIMALGYTSKLTGLINNADIAKFNKIAFQAFIPFLMFYNIYHSDINAGARPGLVVFTVCGVLAVYTAAAFIVMRTVGDPDERGVMIQAIYRSNYVVIGLPIAEALVSAEQLGAVTMLIAVIVPVYNVLAVVTLTVFRGEKMPVKKTIISILTNPIILGAAAGLIAKGAGLQLPEFLDKVVRSMSNMASPLLLFLLGGFFRFSGIGRYKKQLTWATVGRLVLVPGVMLPLGALLGFRGGEFVALIGCFASSNAVSSFTMVQQMGGNEELAGDVVVITSALCVVTVFGWALLYKTLGMF